MSTSSDEKHPSMAAIPFIQPERKKIVLNGPLEKVVVGIDVGATRTRVAIMQHKKDEVDKFEPIVVRNIPSVVSFLPDGKCIVGWLAEKRKIASPLNTFYATKRLTGRRYLDSLTIETLDRVGYHIFESPDGFAWLVSTNRCRILTPAQIDALLVLKIKELCETELNMSIEKVVLTVPPYFKDSQSQITKRIGSTAGVNVIDIINTPIAAVLAYSSVSNTAKARKNTVVYDFGGSTFNVTVLKICKDLTYPEVISTAEDLLLGGENLDFALVDYFVTELQRITKVNPRLCPILMQYLKESAENAKRELTLYTEVDVKFWTIRAPALTKEIDIVIIKLTRTKFEELVSDLIERTVSVCHKALKEANMSVSDIDEVLAIGGTCRIPKVKATIEGIFGKPPAAIQSKNIDRANAVAVGAAIRGHDLRCLICDEPSRPPAPPNNIPKPVTETEKCCFVVSDEEVNTEAITENFIEAGVWGLHAEDQADSYVLSRNLFPPYESEEGCQAYYIICYRAHMESLREMEERPIKEIETLISFLRQKKEKFVKDELSRLLPLPSSSGIVTFLL